MTALDRAERYLAIPARDGAELGGLWWSSRRDAVERRDGTTLAVTDEVRAVLDGALAHPAVPAFAFVLNVLHLMKAGGGHGFDSLSRAYAGTRGVAARGRNVGLLIAELCRLLPWVPGSIKMEDVAVALRRSACTGRTRARNRSKSRRTRGLNSRLTSPAGSPITTRRRWSTGSPTGAARGRADRGSRSRRNRSRSGWRGCWPAPACAAARRRRGPRPRRSTPR